MQQQVASSLAEAPSVVYHPHVSEIADIRKRRLLARPATWACQCDDIRKPEVRDMTTATARRAPRSRSKATTPAAQAARAARQAGADTAQDFAALIADAEAARMRLEKSLAA